MSWWWLYTTAQGARSMMDGCRSGGFRCFISWPSRCGCDENALSGAVNGQIDQYRGVHPALIPIEQKSTTNQPTTYTCIAPRRCIGSFCSPYLHHSSYQRGGAICMYINVLSTGITTHHLLPNPTQPRSLGELYTTFRNNWEKKRGK